MLFLMLIEGTAPKSAPKIGKENPEKTRRKDD